MDCGHGPTLIIVSSTNIEVLNALSAEIDLYITMMYVMVESLRQERAGQENEGMCISTVVHVL